MTTIKNPDIDKEWFSVLKEEFEADYFKNLKLFLVEEKKKQLIYPKGDRIFAAYNYTPLSKVKVVIIGQDPYHGIGQANGLCFSVSNGVKPPPSLVNIFKELKDDLGIAIPSSGNIEKWASEGVLLLNSILTVRANEAGSHQNQGWEKFTDATIRAISEHRNNIVFLLWGKFAQSKAVLIDTHKHFILTAAHPSPFSAYNGFMGCKHFSKTNTILASNGVNPIDWKLA